jgi:hypothetical protein
MMPTIKKNKNKREEKRRQVAYLLRQAHPAAEAAVSLACSRVQQPLSRERMPVTLASEFFQYIITNNISKFGIVKLHRVLLDSEYPTATLPESVSCVCDSPFITLLIFANMRRRDKIVAALVRCGADASVYPGVKRESTFDVASALNNFPPSYCVWLIRKLYSMAEHACKFASQSTEEDVASGIAAAHMKGKRCTVCSIITTARGMEAVRPDGDRFLLTWDCGHSLCWECSWVAACRPLAACGHAFRCPVPGCLQRCDGGDDDFFCALTTPPSPPPPPPPEQSFPKVPSHDEAVHRKIEVNAQPSERLRRKTESYSKWKQLPSSLEAYGGSGGTEEQSPTASCPKKPVLKSQPFHVVTAQFLGTMQTQRVLELHRASAGGDSYRLHALLEAGVDLDAVNEYGQTALCLACVHNQLASVRYLLWAGADVSVVDNGGFNIFEAVVSNCRTSQQCPGDHDNILTMLKEHISDVAASDEKLSSLVFGQLNIESLLPLCRVCDVSTDRMSVTPLIAADLPHPGAGACFLDSCFSEPFLCFLEAKCGGCPVAAPSKPSCSSRRYYCDTDGRVRQAFSAVFATLCTPSPTPSPPLPIISMTEAASREETPRVTPGETCHAVQGQDQGQDQRLSSVFPFMRFLCYESEGGWLPPHEDLSRSDTSCSPVVTSTHTFILYMKTCAEGGETNLLSSLGTSARREGEGEGEGSILASVKPVRGRLLLFPHRCPHEGAPASSLPKLLLRGEAF